MHKYILIVDDEAQFRKLYAYTLQEAGFEVKVTGTAEEAIDIIEEDLPGLVVSDVRLPGKDGIELLRLSRDKYHQLPFLLVTAYADIRDAVNTLKIGAVDYLEKPIDLDELVAAACDILGSGKYQNDSEIPTTTLKGIIAESPAMRSILRNAYRVAKSDATVLITGESGSGKEILAQFIHQNSNYKNRTMIAVNCAAIPESLLGSELFGHGKGAFTGALKQRTGRFREAQDSSLFLDEIGDMPLPLQPALLRALETHCITPLGSDREIKLNFRLIAATNRNILEDVGNGKFREDLYYRLNVISLELPPLRDRPKDILPLAQKFLTQDPYNKRLSIAATKKILGYHWPGNVRELSNAMEHACLLSNTNVVLPEHLPPVIIRESMVYEPITSSKKPEIKTLRESEIETIQQALKQTNDNRTQAAKLLGITRRGLLSKLKRYGI